MGVGFRLPVARYLCRGKGKRKVKAVTFSLLPNQVVPYHRYALRVIFTILMYWKVLKHTVEKTQDFILDTSEEAGLLPSEKCLSRMGGLFEEAVERLNSSPEFADYVSDLSGMGKKKKAVRFLERINDYKSKTTPQEGVSAIDWDYYSLRGGYFLNAHFLFGTPSQFHMPR